MDILFPQYCLHCQREGKILCPDCLSLIEVSDELFCPFCLKPNRVKKCLYHQKKKLSCLFCACDYNQPLLKKLINTSSYLKATAFPLASLIIAHILSSGNKSFFQDGENSCFFPLPIPKKQEKKIGFNLNKEIAKNLSSFFKIPVKKNPVAKRVFLVDVLFSARENKMEEIAKEIQGEVFGVAIARKD